MKITVDSLQKLAAQFEKVANDIEDIDSERPEELYAYHLRCAADEIDQASQELEATQLLETINEEV